MTCCTPSFVQDRKFYAHRIALLASSDTFRAMFDGHYKEKQASVIPIPNIRFAVFERMMRCIYTGAALVNQIWSHNRLAAPARQGWPVIALCAS